MATAFLGINTTDSGTPQAVRIVNASAYQVGVPFGTNDTTSGGLANGSSVGAFNYVNRVISFGGDQKTFIATVGTAIFRTTDEFATVSSVQTLTSLTASTVYKTGIHVCDVGGVPTAVIMYVVTATTARAMKSTDGITWTDSGTSGALRSWNAASTSQAILDQIVYHNVLYLYGSQGTGGTNCLVWYFDPATSTFGSFDPGANACGGTLGIWQDALVLLRSTSAGVIELADLTAASNTTMLTGIATGGFLAPANNVSMKFGMFVDPNTGNLITFFYATGPGGTLQCYRITPGLVTTRLTNIVLPSAISSLGGTLAKAMPFMDLAQNIGGTPTVYVYFAPNGGLTASGIVGTTWTMYKWIDDATEMSFVDTGSTVRHALSINPGPVGGQYSYTTGQRRVRCTARTAVLGGMRYTFLLYSDSGADSVKVQGVFGTATEEQLSHAATLSNPSVGTITGGFNTGLTADGTTSYQVTWLAGTDGIGQGQRHKFALNVVAA
jgi:hypothetical protein